VVDDSNVARAEMKRLLTVQHYNLVHARSGEEALEILHKHSTIKLVISDSHMDGLTGEETAKIIREDYKKDDLAIIGVSSTGGQNISAVFIKNGANDFLVKPFLPDEFHCQINQNIESIETITTYREANALKNLAIGMAAHDIRGPIGIMQALAELSLEVSKAKRYQHLKTIYETGKDTLELLDSLLNMTVIETGKITVEPQTVDLSAPVKQRIDVYEHISDKKNNDQTKFGGRQRASL